MGQTMKYAIIIFVGVVMALFMLMLVGGVLELIR
jgi:hypothetical protein